MNNLKLNSLDRSSLIYNTIKNCKVSGNIRKTNWLYNRALKGFFYGIEAKNEEVAKNFADQMDSMISVLNETHLISNSNNENHTIKGLIVSFRVRKSGLTNENSQSIYAFYDIKGTRSYQSYEEWFVGYLHSHLPANRFSSFSDAMRFSDFCLGDDTEIRYQQESLYEEYSPEMFQLFLWTLSSIVNWESIEGVPHINMNRIVI